MNEQMPLISECSASGCAYNHEGNCCVMAINVGGPAPLCDTYVSGGSKAGMKGMMAGVGACKVSSCANNDSLMCQAEFVRVEVLDGQAVCATFRAS
jgi:hypothetical protein